MKNSMIYVLITTILFTTHEPVTKLFSSSFDPYSITAIRFLIGGLVLLPFSLMEIKKKSLKLGIKDFLVIGSLGILFICVSMVILQISVSIADNTAIIAIIFSSNSIITIVLSCLFLKNKMSKKKIFGVLLCALGVVVAADFSSGGTNILSLVLAFISALTFSIYTVISKKYMVHFSGVIQTGISFIIGSIVLLVIISMFGVAKIHDVSAKNVFELLYVAVFVTGIGYYVYFATIKTGGAQSAALIFLIKPVLAPLAAFLILGTKMNINIIFALIFVLMGTLLINETKLKINRIPILQKIITKI